MKRQGYFNDIEEGEVTNKPPMLLFLIVALAIVIFAFVAAQIQAGAGIFVVLILTSIWTIHASQKWGRRITNG